MISSNTPRLSYTGDGSTTTFSFPYFFIAKQQLTVIRVTAAGVATTQTYTTHYSVTATANASGVYPSGGSVVMVTAPASGDTLIIISTPALTQLSSWVDGDADPASTKNNAFDKLTLQVQRLNSQMARAVMLPDSSTATFSPTLPRVPVAGAALILNDLATGIGYGEPAFSGFYNVKSDFGATGDGVTDDTVALQAAIASNYPLHWPAGTYLITETLLVYNKVSLYWKGEVNKTVIMNKASANKISVIFQDVRAFVVDGFVIAGNSSFPNHGLKFYCANPATDLQVSKGLIQNIYLQPAGIGIILERVALLQFKNINYWSGDISVGSTSTEAQRTHAVFVDATLSNQSCNAVSFQGCILNGAGNLTGQVMVKMGVTTLGNMANVTFEDCLLEGASYKAFDITTAYNFVIRNCFTELATIAFHDSRECLIQSVFNPSAITLDTSCVFVMLQSVIMGNTGHTYTIDSSCFYCGAMDSEVNVVSDSGTGSVFRNWRLAGALQVDKGNRTVIAGAGTASTPGLKITGAPYVAGSATTNKPQLLLEDAATTNNWSTAGTYFGVNALTGFVGNLLDLQLNAVSKFKVTSAGAVTFASSLTINSVVVGSAANTISGLSTIVNTGTLTLPTSTDTLVGRATTDTLTNKTLTSPIFSTIVNTGTLTLPTSTDTLVGKATTDTLTNKTLSAGTLSGITTMPGTSALTAAGLLGLGTTNPGSLIELYGWANGNALRINYGTATGEITQFISLYANGTVNASIGAQLTDANNGGLNFYTRGSGTLTRRLAISSAGDGVMGGSLTANSVVLGAAPNRIDGLATIVNSGTLTLPTSTDTLVGRATTDTLTNKTINTGSNTFIFTPTTYTTPLGVELFTVIDIPNFDPGNYNQILALGLPAAATDTARAITLLDARASSHQGTLLVLSPNEGTGFGMTWDGQNDYGFLKSGVGLGFRVGANAATAGITSFIIDSTGALWTLLNATNQHRITMGGTAGRFLLDGDSGGAGGALMLHGTTHATNASEAIVQAATHRLRNLAGTDRMTLDTSGNMLVGGTLGVASSVGVGGVLAVTGASTLTGGIVGSDGTANASTGNVGQYVETLVTTATNVAATSTYQDFGAAISLTAGDWDVSFMLDFTLNGSVTTYVDMGIGTATGASGAGMTTGVNEMVGQPPTATAASAMYIPSFRVRVSATTSYYGKVNCGFSAGNPQFVGRLSARRVR